MDKSNYYELILVSLVEENTVSFVAFSVISLICLLTMVFIETRSKKMGGAQQ